MIKEINFIRDFELNVEKESHYRFRTETITPGKYDKENEPFDIFFLFNKDLTIPLNNDVNVIVGENGSGKSSLIRELKKYIGTRPNYMWRSKQEEQIEDYKKRVIRDREKNTHIKLIEDKPYRDFTNTIYFDGEKDNPLISIPQEANPMSSDFNSLAARLYFTQEESHGESMLPILKYIVEENNDCLIIMDEPETALSLKNQIQFAQKIKESSEKKGNQFIISTHSLAIISEFSFVFDMETRFWVNREKYVNNIMNMFN